MMADIRISDMMSMQMNLWEKHRDTWSPMEAEYRRFYADIISSYNFITV